MITARSRAIKLTHVRPAIDGGTADVRELSPCLAKRNTEGVDLPRIDFRISDVDLGETFGSGVATSAVYISNAKERFASCACGEVDSWQTREGGEVSVRTKKGGKGVCLFLQERLWCEENLVFFCAILGEYDIPLPEIYIHFSLLLPTSSCIIYDQLRGRESIMNLFRKILKDFPGRLRNVPCKARGFMRDYRSPFSRGDSSEYPVSPQTQNREQGLLPLSLELQKKSSMSASR